MGIERRGAESPPGLEELSSRLEDFGPDRTVEMSAEDAKYLIREGWTKLAEWTGDEAT